MPWKDFPPKHNSRDLSNKSCPKRPAVCSLIPASASSCIFARNSSTPSIDSILAAKEAARQNFERGASTSHDVNTYSVAEDVQHTQGLSTKSMFNMLTVTVIRVNHSYRLINLFLE